MACSLRSPSRFGLRVLAAGGLWLLGALVAPAAALAGPGADAAAIRGALLHDVHVHRLPWGDAAGDLRCLRRTLVLQSLLAEQGRGGRAGALADALHQAALIARRGLLTRVRHVEVFRQLDANRRWFARHDAPASRARVRVPGDVLVYGYYPGRGLVLQPLFNWVAVNRSWFARDVIGMQRQIDALAPLAVRQPGGWLAWEYDFDYASGTAPWRSAMAQGVALQVLARAWHATGDPVDLALARSVLRGLVRGGTGGGLRLAGTRPWWPLYGFEPGLRILNGDLQVVISLLDYARITGDRQARRVGLDGARSALASLPSYDTGAWSLYDGHTEADLGYHDLMTRQLQQLAQRTRLAGFAREAHRFAVYRVTPPRVRVQPRPPVVLYPAPRDGFRDRFSVAGTLDKQATLGASVVDARGRTVWAEPLGGFGRGGVRIGWDGTLAGGAAAPPGRYTLRVRGVDIAGNRSRPLRVARVVVRRDTAPPRILSLAARRAGGAVRLSWSVRDPLSPWFTLWVTSGRGTVVLRGRASRGSLLLGLHAPRHGFALRVRAFDTSGNGRLRVVQVPARHR